MYLYFKPLNFLNSHHFSTLYIFVNNLCIPFNEFTFINNLSIFWFYIVNIYIYISLTCWVSFHFGGLALESELDRVLNLSMNSTCPEECLFLLWSSNWPHNNWPIGDMWSPLGLGTPGGNPPPGGLHCSIFPGEIESRKWLSSIDWSILALWCRLPGFFTPERSDFDLGRKVSAKKLFTLADVEGECFMSSPDCLRCLFLLNSPLNPVEPARGR